MNKKKADSAAAQDPIETLLGSVQDLLLRNAEDRKRMDNIEAWIARVARVGDNTTETLNARIDRRMSSKLFEIKKEIATISRDVIVDRDTMASIIGDPAEGLGLAGMIERNTETLDLISDIVLFMLLNFYTRRDSAEIADKLMGRLRTRLKKRMEANNERTKNTGTG